jgi:hypothetical protein
VRGGGEGREAERDEGREVGRSGARGRGGAGARGQGREKKSARVRGVSGFVSRLGFRV